MMRKLPRDFYNRDTKIVAQALLGKYLVHVVEGIPYIGRIVEVEAYLGEHDLAAHSSKGLTKRNQVMYGPPGFAYVYLIYGLHYCMNVVTEAAQQPAAVLIRAVQPVKNIVARTNGPGLLCRAMHIDKRLQGCDLTGVDFYLTEPLVVEPFKIVKSARIGVPYAKHWAKRLLRFYIKDNAFVSRR